MIPYCSHSKLYLFLRISTSLTSMAPQSCQNVAAEAEVAMPFSLPVIGSGQCDGKGGLLGPLTDVFSVLKRSIILGFFFPFWLKNFCEVLLLSYDTMGTKVGMLKMAE